MQKRLSAIAIGGLLAVTFATGTASARDTCADRACFHDRPGTPSCKALRAGRGLTAEQRMVRCFVGRAARHFRWPEWDAQYVAHRESRWTEVGSNSFGYRGPFQMSMTLWNLTPYRHGHGRNEARYAALAFALISSRGGRCNWNPPSYCA